MLTITKIPPAAKRSGRPAGYLHLILVSFLYEQDVGEKKLSLTGAVVAGSLSVEQRSGR